MARERLSLRFLREARGDRGVGSGSGSRGGRVPRGSRRAQPPGRRRGPTPPPPTTTKGPRTIPPHPRRRSAETRRDRGLKLRILVRPSPSPRRRSAPSSSDAECAADDAERGPSRGADLRQGALRGVPRAARVFDLLRALVERGGVVRRYPHAVLPRGVARGGGVRVGEVRREVAADDEDGVALVLELREERGEVELGDGLRRREHGVEVPPVALGVRLALPVHGRAPRVAPADGEPCWSRLHRNALALGLAPRSPRSIARAHRRSASSARVRTWMLKLPFAAALPESSAMYQKSGTTPEALAVSFSSNSWAIVPRSCAERPCSSALSACTPQSRLCFSW